VADLKVGDMSNQAPVGTTLAILERTLKVMSAVQARVHAAMKHEFKLIAAIVRDYTPESYSYEVDAPKKAKRDDYDMVDIIPVSDPNASTMAQRVVQYQAALQLAASAPGIYDLPQLHRQMLEVLGIKNVAKIIPIEDEQKPMNPVSENMAALSGKPIKAFLYQDHEAHLKVHMSAMQDPKMQQIIGQNPQAQVIQAAMMASPAGRTIAGGHRGRAFPRCCDCSRKAVAKGSGRSCSEASPASHARPCCPAAKPRTGHPRSRSHAEKSQGRSRVGASRRRPYRQRPAGKRADCGTRANCWRTDWGKSRRFGQEHRFQATYRRHEDRSRPWH